MFVYYIMLSKRCVDLMCFVLSYCILYAILVTVYNRSVSNMSQDAVKSMGICSVCHGEYRLQKSGVLYLHDSRKGPHCRCEGSNCRPFTGNLADVPPTQGVAVPMPPPVPTLNAHKSPLRT